MTIHAPLLYHQKAYTLIELMIVVAIISIIAIIAYPSILQALQSMESKRVENEIRQALRQARSESSITKQDIVVCTADMTGQCNRLAQDSLLVFNDQNRNGALDDAETPTYQTALKLKYGIISVNASLRRHYIRYQGSTNRPTGHFGHVKYCSFSDNQRLSFKVILNSYGHVRIESQELADIQC